MNIIEEAELKYGKGDNNNLDPVKKVMITNTPMDDNTMEGRSELESMRQRQETPPRRPPIW